MLISKKYVPCLSTLLGAGIGLGIGTGIGTILSLAIEQGILIPIWVIMPGYIGFMIGASAGCITAPRDPTPTERIQRIQGNQNNEAISAMAPAYNVSPSALERLGLPPEQSILSLRETVEPLTPSKSSAPATPREPTSIPVYVSKETHLNVPTGSVGSIFFKPTQSP